MEKWDETLPLSQLTPKISHPRKEALITGWMIRRNAHLCKSLGQTGSRDENCSCCEESQASALQQVDERECGGCLWVLSVWVITSPAQAASRPWAPASPAACPLPVPGPTARSGSSHRLGPPGRKKYMAAKAIPYGLIENLKVKSSVWKRASNKKASIDGPFVYQLGILISSE